MPGSNGHSANEQINLDTKTHRVKKPLPAPNAEGGCDFDFRDLVILGLGGIDDTNVAFLNLPNVFQRETTFNGLRLGDIKVVTGNYTVLPTDCIILVNANFNPVTVTLPVAGANGQYIWVRKIDSTDNPVTIQARVTDLIDTEPFVTISDFRRSILVTDAQPHVWNEMISSFLAYTNSPNEFQDVSTLAGVRFAPPKLITDDYELQDSDCVVMVDATAGDINLTLPVSNGSGQFYYIVKADDTSHAVSVNCQEDDLITGAISMTFNKPGADAMLIAAGLNFWANPGNFDPPPAPKTDVPWWYKPSLNDTTLVAAWPTLGNPINSRLDTRFPDGFRVYTIQSGAADVNDPGQIPPNDYDATLNNVHWHRDL